MSDENNENNKFWNSFKNILLVITFVTSILAIFLNVLATPEAFSRFWVTINNFLNPPRVQLLINIGNIAMSGYFLVVFLLPSKISGKYEIKWGEKEYDFCELAELERDVEGKTIPAKSQEILKGYQKRVAALVIQYLWIIRFFAISLVFVYLAIICSSIDVAQQKEYSLLFRVGDLNEPVSLAVKLHYAQDPLSLYLREKFSPETLRQLDQYDGFNLPFELLQRTLTDGFNHVLTDSDLFSDHRFAQVGLPEDIRGLVEQKPQGEGLIRLNRTLLESAYPHEIAKIQKEDYRPITNFAKAINIFNFLGGIVIFLAFWVLYSDTLNKHDKDNRFWVIPCVFAGIYTALFIYLSWLFKPDENAYLFLNRFDLFAGLINGLAMFLLFGRYVSLEQSLSKTILFKDAFRDLFKPLPIFESEKSYKKIVSFGIIFLLPIYALAQPQFGALQIPLYGNPIIFQTTVYGTCLIGKFCFFHLTYLLISKKLLHLYLYGLVAKVGNFRKLEECLTVNPRIPD